MTATARARIVLVGAGSRSFGPATVRDVLLSRPLRKRGVELVLMDTSRKALDETLAYARRINRRLKAGAVVTGTSRLEAAVDGASAVVTAIERDRYRYWAQDFHVPRTYGFRQIYGENGGPGGLFHALRNMGPTLAICRAMERRAPEAILLNYTNPETKLVEAISRLTRIKAVGLCHGVHMGMRQIAHILNRPVDSIEYAACGMNHFTWFQTIRDRRTGADLYPALRAAERAGDWLAEFHELSLSRILFRRFGLWPSPGTNHHGEYLRWADEFYASQAQFFSDAADGPPWAAGTSVPEFVYSLAYTKTDRPWLAKPRDRADGKGSPDDRSRNKPLKFSGEYAVPIMESLLCGVRHEILAINCRNDGAIPNLPDDMVVEVPADADSRGWTPRSMAPLPEAVAAVCRQYASIHKLLVEAYAERSKAKLLQAMLLEPTVHSYRAAVACVDEMLKLQRGVLPPLH